VLLTFFFSGFASVKITFPVLDAFVVFVSSFLCSKDLRAEAKEDFQEEKTAHWIFPSSNTIRFGTDWLLLFEISILISFFTDQKTMMQNPPGRLQRPRVPRISSEDDDVFQVSQALSSRPTEYTQQEKSSYSVPAVGRESREAPTSHRMGLTGLMSPDDDVSMSSESLQPHRMSVEEERSEHRVSYAPPRPKDYSPELARIRDVLANWSRDPHGVQKYAMNLGQNIATYLAGSEAAAKPFYIDPEAFRQGDEIRLFEDLWKSFDGMQWKPGEIFVKALYDTSANDKILNPWRVMTKQQLLKRFVNRLRNLGDALIYDEWRTESTVHGTASIRGSPGETTSSHRRTGTQSLVINALGFDAPMSWVIDATQEQYVESQLIAMAQRMNMTQGYRLLCVLYETAARLKSETEIAHVKTFSEQGFIDFFVTKADRQFGVDKPGIGMSGYETEARAVMKARGGKEVDVVYVGSGVLQAQYIDNMMKNYNDIQGPSATANGDKPLPMASTDQVTLLYRVLYIESQYYPMGNGLPHIDPLHRRLTFGHYANMSHQIRRGRPGPAGNLKDEDYDSNELNIFVADPRTKTDLLYAGEEALFHCGMFHTTAPYDITELGKELLAQLCGFSKTHVPTNLDVRGVSTDFTLYALLHASGVHVSAIQKICKNRKIFERLQAELIRQGQDSRLRSAANAGPMHHIGGMNVPASVAGTVRGSRSLVGLLQSGNAAAVARASQSLGGGVPSVTDLPAHSMSGSKVRSVGNVRPQRMVDETYLLKLLTDFLPFDEYNRGRQLLVMRAECQDIEAVRSMDEYTRLLDRIAGDFLSQDFTRLAQSDVQKQRSIAHSIVSDYQHLFAAQTDAASRDAVLLTAAVMVSMSVVDKPNNAQAGAVLLNAAMSKKAVQNPSSNPAQEIHRTVVSFASTADPNKLVEMKTEHEKYLTAVATLWNDKSGTLKSVVTSDSFLKTHPTALMQLLHLPTTTQQHPPIKAIADPDDQKKANESLQSFAMAANIRFSSRPEPSPVECAAVRKAILHLMRGSTDPISQLIGTWGNQLFAITKTSDFSKANTILATIFRDADKYLTSDEVLIVTQDAVDVDKAGAKHTAGKGKKTGGKKRMALGFPGVEDDDDNDDDSDDPMTGSSKKEVTTEMVIQLLRNLKIRYETLQELLHNHIDLPFEFTVYWPYIDITGGNAVWAIQNDETAVIVLDDGAILTTHDNLAFSVNFKAQFKSLVFNMNPLNLHLTPAIAALGYHRGASKNWFNIDKHLEHIVNINPTFTCFSFIRPRSHGGELPSVIHPMGHFNSLLCPASASGQPHYPTAEVYAKHLGFQHHAEHSLSVTSYNRIFGPPSRRGGEAYKCSWKAYNRRTRDFDRVVPGFSPLGRVITEDTWLKLNRSNAYAGAGTGFGMAAGVRV
jgi:hypothetical protein